MDPVIEDLIHQVDTEVAYDRLSWEAFNELVEGSTRAWDEHIRAHDELHGCSS